MLLAAVDRTLPKLEYTAPPHEFSGLRLARAVVDGVVVGEVAFGEAGCRVEVTLQWSTRPAEPQWFET